MLNTQVFTDTDGHRVEIDRRELVDAYIERAPDRSTIQLTWGEGKAISLGIGAREAVESWLGRELEFLSPVAAAYLPNLKPRGDIMKGREWLDLRLAVLRDEAIVRCGPAAAAWHIAALAMIVLHPPIGDVPVRHQRAYRLLRQAVDALQAEVGDYVPAFEGEAQP
jgi:hypothetical protein